MNWVITKRTAMFCLAAGGITFGAAVAQAQELQTINILTASNTACNLYGQFVATELGINEDLGIQVNLLNSETTIPKAAFLTTRDADLIMLDPAETLQMLDAGIEASIVYEVHQFATEGIVVLADSDIQGLEDLEGATVGLATDRDRTTTAIALGTVGLGIDDVETAVVGISGPVLARALREGSIDAYAGGSSDRAALEIAGVEFRNITPAVVSQVPGNSFVILDERKEELADIVSSFLKGWAMATHAGVNDTNAVNSICRQVAPEHFEDLEVGLSYMDNAIYDLNLRRTKDFGEPQVDVWESVQGPLVDVGEISQTYDVSGFVDDRFIEAANDWTTTELKAYIDRWKEANPDKLIQ